MAHSEGGHADYQSLVQRSALVAAALTLVLGSASPARGTTYFVRAAGDDAHDGLTPETAFASIRPTARLLRHPGDRVIVGPGIYHEGNIEPRGSGTPEAPIAFLGDATGVLTGDPPGAVMIVPPNAKDSTTGFIVYGRHDIQIEGFEVDGAKDAGIQVRPNPRTGADSSRVSAVSNTISGGSKGVQFTASDDISVLDNTLVGNRGTGVVFTGGTTGAVHPLVRGNVIEQNGGGIRASHSSGGTILQNRLRANVQSLTLVSVDNLTIVGNAVLDPGSGDELKAATATNLKFIGNVFERGGVIRGVSGTLVLAQNRFASGFGVVIFGADRTLLLENHFGRAYVTGGVQLDFDQNDADALEAKGLEAIVATDNRLSGSMKALAAAHVEASRNEAAHLLARGTTALIRDNTFTNGAVIKTDKATAVGNRGAFLDIVTDNGLSTALSDADRSFVVENNVLSGPLSIGEPAAANIVVQDNVMAGILRVAARHTLEVRRNHARGIGCTLSAPDSRLVLADSTSRESVSATARQRQPAPAPIAGLLVIGAGRAVVENNTSSDSADCGLVARRINQLTIVGNTFRANAAGGISVETRLAGDCNGDLHVGINELVSVVGVALETRPLHECDAADVDGNGAVTVDEIVQSVEAALELPANTNSFVEIRANHVEDNGRFGINVFAVGSVTAIDNRVVHNGGIPIALHGRGLSDYIEVVDNVLGLGGAQGLLLEDVAGARVRDNVIFSNREAGILLRGAPGASVVNNLVYANRNDGIAVGLGSALPASNAVLMNNTLYANAGWGIAIGGSVAPSTGAVVLNNILQHNARGGIAAGVESLLGLTVGFNLNDDGYGDDVLPEPTDFVADPQFVAPAGADGILGGAGFADDDFHLQPTSPAINAGSAPAAALGISGSAIAGLATDEGIVDLGYHYGADEP